MSPLAKELLVRGLDDWLCAYELPYYATQRAGAANPVEQRRFSLEAVKLLFQRALWIPGEVGRTAFEPWNLDPEAAFARIENEWLPGWLPGYNDICWFANTELGIACANGLVADGFKTLEDD